MHRDTDVLRATSVSQDRMVPLWFYNLYQEHTTFKHNSSSLASVSRCL